MIKWLCFSIYFSVLLALIYRVDPFLFSNKLLIRKLHLESNIWETVSFAQIQPSLLQTEPEFYRGDLSRSAIFKIKNLNFDLRPVWLSDQINVGVHDASKASIIGDDSAIFVGSDSSLFYSFSTSGKLLWKIYFGNSARGIHSTAALDEDSVYVGSYAGMIYRIDKKTGRIIWMRRIGNAVGASPFIDQDFILFAVETEAPNGYLLKIKKQSGEIIWKSPNFGEQAHSSPALDLKNSVVILGVNNSTVQGFDYETGQRIWKLKAKGPVKSTPLLRDGIGYVTDWGHKITAFNTKTGTKVWRKNMNDRSQVSPVFLQNPKLVVTADRSGTIYAFDAATGEEKWNIKNEIQYQISSPVVVSDTRNEKILLACASHKMCLISSNGKIEKTWPLDNLFTGSPFLHRDQLFLSFNEGSIEAFQIETRH